MNSLHDCEESGKVTGSFQVFNITSSPSLPTPPVLLFYSRFALTPKSNSQQLPVWVLSSYFLIYLHRILPAPCDSRHQPISKIQNSLKVKEVVKVFSIMLLPKRKYAKRVLRTLAVQCCFRTYGWG